MIHVVGNVALDTILRVDRFPEPGETIVARGASEDLGGKGANQAIVIARCGREVRLVAAIGDDAAGERMRANLRAEGVADDGLWTWPGASDHCVITVDRDGENTVVSLVEAARNFDPIASGALDRRIAAGDWVVMQGNLRASVTSACLAFAREERATTVLNPSPVYPADEYDWSLVDLVVLNRGEAAALGERDTPVEAARALLGAGAGAVVLTLGADGAMLFTAGETVRVQAPRTKAIDTTGAGDVFCGALVAARSTGVAWRDALDAAARAAAISVERRGVLASFPTREELAAILSHKLVVEQGHG